MTPAGRHGGPPWENLVDGRWTTAWYDTKATGGRFVRSVAQLRRQIGDGLDLPAVAGRYHLFVSMACPWAHRTLIVRKLKGLEDVISVSGVEALMLDEGWVLDPTDDHPVDGVRLLHEVYTRHDPRYTGRVTVPVLWDKERGEIVNNESSEIIRMLGRNFDHLATGPGADLDLYPKALREEIDAVNERVYGEVNNGVYRCGFATTQQAYDEAARALFSALGWLEKRLDGRQWLVGDQQTEADWRLFTTLVRFDPIYHGHFKCNASRIADLPNLSAYLQRLLRVPGILDTIDLEHARRHYYGSHTSINPHGIVPVGPPLGLPDAAPSPRPALSHAV